MAAVVALENGGSLRAWFVSERVPNNYPALPVREDTNVLVSFASFPNGARVDDYIDALRSLDGFSEVLQLIPTARSRLR
jgi:hypothetical protein